MRKSIDFMKVYTYMLTKWHYNSTVQYQMTQPEFIDSLNTTHPTPLGT